MLNRFVRTTAILLGLGMMFPTFAQDTYQIDSIHSQIGFKIRHLVAKTSGRFTKFEGTIKVDTADITKSSVEVSIDAASVNTDNAGRDEHLRKPDFFDVQQFPRITFKSTAVKEVAKGKLEVTGQFTMHGVTRTITFPISSAGTMPHPMQKGKVVAGFIDGALTINRNDYGIKTYPGVLGDDVEISLNIEAIK